VDKITLYQPQPNQQLSIGGGYGNQITGTNSFTNSIVGGYQNIIRDDAKYSSIVGGSGNIIDGNNVGAGQSGRMFIGGGRDNTLSGSNYSNIVGGYNNTINTSIYSSIIGGESNIVNHNHSHIIGSNITSVSANTTHVERFNIGTIDSGSASTDILVREANGMVNLISASAITTNDTFISGMTFNTGNYDLTIHRNDAVDFTQSLSILSGDMVVTGGTYDINTGIVEFTNNSGGTFNVSGFTSGMTDSYTTTAYTTGNIVHFDNNVQGSDVYEVDLTPVISGFGTTNKYVESFAFTAATTSTITHNLGDTDVMVQVKDASGQLITPNVVDNYTTNTVDINVSATETMRVIIIG
jgi:hypothetical protein